MGARLDEGPADAALPSDRQRARSIAIFARSARFICKPYRLIGHTRKGNYDFPLSVYERWPSDAFVIL